MNWLFLPHTGKVNLEAESNFILYRDFARYIAKKYNDKVFFCYSEWCKNPPQDEKGIEFVPIAKDKIFFRDMCSLDTKVLEKFAPNGFVPIEAVLTSKPVIIMLLAGVGLNNVLYFEPGAWDKFERIKGSVLSRLVCFGYGLASKVLVLSDKDEEVILNEAREWLTPSSYIRLQENIVQTAVGVPVELIDEMRPRIKRNDKFTLFFGARINDVKNVEAIVNLFDLFYRSGRNIKIVLCTSSNQAQAKSLIGDMLKKNKDIELVCDVPRKEYLELAMRSHVYVAWSYREGFPVGFWEQIYASLVGVLVGRDWTRKFDNIDYPYIFNNLQEAYTMLLDIYDNYDKRLAELQKYRDYVNKNYCIDTIYTQWRELGAGGVSFKKMSRRGIELMDLVLEKYKLAEKDSVTWKDFFKFINKESECKYPYNALGCAVKQGYCTNSQLYYYLREKGFQFEINAKNEDIKFSKKGFNN